MAYTTIDDPSAHFQVVTYTGNNGSQSITLNGNSNLQADWGWWKRRNTAADHSLIDSSRGVTKHLVSNTTGAEQTASAGTELVSFDSNGFTLGAVNVTNSLNGNSDSIVAWLWKANGGTTSSFTESGSNPGGNYQANTTAGFSIVTYTGTGSNGTVQHGLSSAPELVIVKQRDDNEHDWQTGSDFLTSWAYRLKLNDSVAEASVATSFNSTGPTSSVFTVGSNSDVNEDAHGYVGYCFHSVQGYSKIGKYTGNGSSSDGPFVYTGFKPAFFLIKSFAAKNWHILDNKRNTINPVNLYLNPNNTDADGTFTFGDFLSNGFKITNNGNTFNNNGEVYLYYAIAEHPFVSSKGVPVTAR